MLIFVNEQPPCPGDRFFHTLMRLFNPPDTSPEPSDGVLNPKNGVPQPLPTRPEPQRCGSPTPPMAS